MSRATKLERVAHANDLIKAIGSHGRRFFWNECDQRFARLELDERGKVWFIDDYRGARVFTHQTNFTNHWKGFSHGGTLRSLVESMRDYIVHGTPIPRWRIATEQLYGDHDVWGYGAEASTAVRLAAFALPIMEITR